eukprot:3941654-Rhodomonas_salina.1
MNRKRLKGTLGRADAKYAPLPAYALSAMLLRAFCYAATLCFCTVCRYLPRRCVLYCAPLFCTLFLLWSYVLFVYWAGASSVYCRCTRCPERVCTRCTTRQGIAVLCLCCLYCATCSSCLLYGMHTRCTDTVYQAACLSRSLCAHAVLTSHAHGVLPGRASQYCSRSSWSSLALWPPSLRYPPTPTSLFSTMLLPPRPYGFSPLLPYYAVVLEYYCTVLQCYSPSLWPPSPH